MVSYQGTCEFFDFTALFPPNPSPVITSYPEHSVMYYLQQHHATFAYIAKLAKMDGYLANDTLRSTLFLPLESSFPENILLNMDINVARRIIKYHLMTGLFPYDVLLTSPYQELQTTIKGSTIVCMYYDSRLYLNNMNPIIKSDIRLKNGIIHWIENSLILS